MPMIYSLSLATAGNLTTNATPNTETETFFTKPGASRPVGLQSIQLQGKGAGLTSLSGIILRLISWATASTAGTGMTPRPKDTRVGAAVATAASRPTSGTTRTNHVVVGCGAAGPGGYIAPNVDSPMVLDGGSAASISCMDACGTASMAFEWSAEIAE